MTEKNGRAWYTYQGEEPASLPEYLNPLPGIVEPGDRFSVDATRAGDVTGDRFTPADPPTDGGSPNAALTKAQLAEKLGDPSLADDHTKAELVALADDHDKSTPEPIGNPDQEDENR